MYTRELLNIFTGSMESHIRNKQNLLKQLQDQHYHRQHLLQDLDYRKLQQVSNCNRKSLFS